MREYAMRSRFSAGFDGAGEPLSHAPGAGRGFGINRFLSMLWRSAADFGKEDARFVSAFV
jgi:hypothetical protein